MTELADRLKIALGSKYNPGSTYSVVKHAEAPSYSARGYTMVGEVPDLSPDPQGTMVVMERPADD